MDQLSTMSEKCRLTDRLKDRKYREAYIRASISVNLPSQIRALRLALPMTQQEFAAEAEMKQPRISAMEKPGATKFNIETLVRLAAAFRVGLIVKFVPVSEMVAWENGFSQDSFIVAPFESDMGLRNYSNRFTSSFPINSSTSVPSWISTPRMLRAVPRDGGDIAMASIQAGAGSTATARYIE